MAQVGLIQICFPAFLTCIKSMCCSVPKGSNCDKINAINQTRVNVLVNKVL